ncbi:MAG: hypothetical protein M0Z41_15205, partial [Peptococcaceae bacterium]|nr:hypothetical protein [Peptococcaceae bacterium]
GAPTLLTQGTVSIGSQHLGNTTPNQSQFTFTVPASDAGDELIVTLNETMNSDQSVNPEGLPVYYRWGPLANTTAPADNSPKDQIVPLNVWNVTSQGTAFDPSGTPIAYSDNAQSLILPGSSGGGGSTGQPALVIAPDTANILVGNTQQYTDTYFPDGQAAGNGQAVTTASTWSTGNDGVASNYEGDQTGQVYGVAPGTTSVTASYDGLTVTAQVNVAAGVAPSGYNLTVENLESGLSGGTATPGDSYTMTATFTTNTPFTVEGANVWWYINSGNGWQAINSVAQPVTIPTNGSTTASMSWIFPASATSVQLMVTVDDPYVNGSFQPEPIAGTTSMETTYSDNSDQTGVGSNTPPPPQPGPIYRSIGTVTMPVTITPPPVTVEVPHTTWVTTWTPISINNTPKKENWGPPHFYLSY